MRHVRMLGLCLVAALLVSALGAGSALAKDPYNQYTWGQYKYCPYENEELTDCFAGITDGGSKGGFFEYGRVKVKLSKSIVLQGGFKGAGEEIEVSPAVHGGETLEAPELPVSGGIGLFTKEVQEEEEWPAALVESWKQAKKNKEKTINVKIEMAGTECFETKGCLSTQNILNRKGVAFRLPLKVKVTGPWLEQLGGGPCYIGSDEHPIHINLTTEGAGASGRVHFNEEFTNILLGPSRLVEHHVDDRTRIRPQRLWRCIRIVHRRVARKRTGNVPKNRYRGADRKPSRRKPIRHFRRRLRERRTAVGTVSLVCAAV